MKLAFSRNDDIYSAMLRHIQPIGEQHVQGFYISRQNHVAIASYLRLLAYDVSLAGLELPIVFMDSSKPACFPVGTLLELENAYSFGVALPEIRVGLMSFRHPEMDYFIDLYATRNLELALQETMAEEEESAFLSCVKLFDDIILANGARIVVYHTGLEPMVVGFYRGIVEILRQRKNQKLPRNLVFIPQFLNANATRKQLTPSSPGAKIASYASGDPWY